MSLHKSQDAGTDCLFAGPGETSLIVGKGYKTRLLNFRDELWDRRLGVRTFGFRSGTGREGESHWRLHYTPTPYRDLFRVFEHVQINHDDVFTDLGSGMGRAVFAAKWAGAKRAIGVEVMRDLHDQAVENRHGSRLDASGIEFVCEDALNVHLGDTTVLYIFHSFGPDTLRAVLKNVEAQKSGSSLKNFRLAYMNPVFASVPDEFGWLRRAGTIRRRARRPLAALCYETVLWQGS